jgi:Zn-dependent oligopeptidase
LFFFKKLNELEKDFGNGLCYLSFLKSVHPEKEIRNACNEAVSELNKLGIEIK